MKKIITYIFSLFLCLGVFAGCSLVSLNAKKYYAQTVVEISYDNADSKTFSMEDLLLAYNQYGSKLLENNSGATVEDALKQTAELMAQQYLLVQHIKSEIGELTVAEKNDLKHSAYASINNELKSLEDEIRVEWDRVIKVESTTEESSEESLRDEYKPYEPTVKMEYYEETVNGVTQLKHRLIRVEAEEVELKSEDPGNFKQDITDADISAEAMKRYIKNLQKNNEELGKNYSDSEALQKQIELVYSILEEQKYIAKYQEYLLNNSEINTKNVLESYKYKYNRDFEKYSNNEEAYHEAMASDASTVYYHPNSGNEYVNVTHILFNFTAEQTAEIERLEKLYKANSITKEVYEQKLADAKDINKTTVTYMENGVKKTTTASLAYADIINNVSKYDANVNFEARAKEFNKYIYKYNDDPGIMNSDFAYVVNLDTNVTDKMVKPFADEARRLHFEEGIGAISQPILTEYGYHVILNLGPVTNVVEYNNIDNLTWEALYNVKTQPSSEKTLFHVEYDAITNSAVSVYLNNLINDLTANTKCITYWPERIESLLKQK